jgi:hypothetical protein
MRISEVLPPRRLIMQTIKKLRSDVGAVQPQKLGHKAPNPSRRLIKARALLAKKRDMLKMPNAHMLLRVLAAHKRAKKVAESTMDRASELAIGLTATEHAERRKALAMLVGLNRHREGGPVDGLEFQLKQRGEW